MRAPQKETVAPDTDNASISRFVEVVFGYLEGYVAVRLLSETGTPDQAPRSEFHEVERLAAALQRCAPVAAREARGLYVVPATVQKPGSARTTDIYQTGILVVDLDQGDIRAARDHLALHLGDPTLEVASGGRTEDGQPKLHLYWMLTEVASGGDLERVRALREIVARKTGADISFRSLHQPIRVPGTIHGKNGIRTPVRIIGDRNLEYDLGDLQEAADAMPSLHGDEKPTRTMARHGNPGSAADLATKRIRAGYADDFSRFEALTKVIGHWLRTHRAGRCSLDDAWDAVSDYNAAMISPPWDEARLRREFEALLKRDIENHGPLLHAHEVPKPMTGPKLIPCSEDALAMEFVARHGPDWRHVATWGKWLQWSEGRWTADNTGYARELVRLVCRDLAGTAGKQSDARRIAGEKTITAVLRISATDPRVATSSPDWDAHPWLLNTPGGFVDLRTGELIPHDPGLLITQMATASPGAGCPRWLSFLDEITGGDVDLQSYLRRLAGYCLTGDTSEQVFAFLHGAGANGKSVFLGTIAAVLGDYAATATNDTFMASRSERHLTELAGLRAARLVIVPETEPGRAWAEARIKAVTGGEKIRANFMRRDHFEFVPQFKLIVAGNHRPVLTGIGEAMRRRLHLVPFEVTIPVAQRDKELATKLLAERDGILGWMLAGCGEWQQIGLAPPDRVQAAAAAYFDEEDIIGQWIEDCCLVGGEQRATARQLFASWTGWAEQAGHSPGSQKTLGTALRERRFKDGKVSGQRGWHGIAPRSGQPGGRAIR